MLVAEHLIASWGMQSHCRRVRACDIPVLELENPAGDACLTILAECQRASAEDGSTAIGRGCAGMADLCQRPSGKLGVPVRAGAAAAVATAQALVSHE